MPSCVAGFDISSTAKRIRMFAWKRHGKKAVALSARHRPDVAILDLIMPGLGGFEAAICAILPECEIAIVTLHDSDELN